MLQDQNEGNKDVNKNIYLNNKLIEQNKELEKAIYEKKRIIDQLDQEIKNKASEPTQKSLSNKKFDSLDNIIAKVEKEKNMNTKYVQHTDNYCK